MGEHFLVSVSQAELLHSAVSRVALTIATGTVVFRSLGTKFVKEIAISLHKDKPLGTLHAHCKPWCGVVDCTFVQLLSCFALYTN